MRLRLIKGDIAKCRANAIVTSANDALCGNDQPLYWRFTNQRNVDGAVRKVAGPGLRDACLALPEIKPVIHENEEPRDISRWAETAKKRGLSKILRCAPGSAVATRAYGLDADWCVHAVAPDSEFGYEGHYQGNIGIRGEDVRATSVPPSGSLMQNDTITRAASRSRSTPRSSTTCSRRSTPRPSRRARASWPFRCRSRRRSARASSPSSAPGRARPPRSPSQAASCNPTPMSHRSSHRTTDSS